MPISLPAGKDIGIDDYHHFARVLPSRLSLSEQKKLDLLAVSGCLALEMSSCAAHVEFIGDRLGEIAARPGGNRARLLELAYGMDELFAYYQVLKGDAPTLTKTRNKAAAIISPYPAKNGILRGINHLDKIINLPGYLYHEIRAQSGSPVGMANAGNRAPLYVELVSENEDDVRQSLDQMIAWSDIYDVD